MLSLSLCLSVSLCRILVRSSEAVTLKFGISPILDLVVVKSSIGLGVICVFILRVCAEGQVVSC